MDAKGGAMLTPNQITILRLALAFLSIGLFSLGGAASWVALALLVITLALDAADGYVARRRHLTSDAGAAFDIAADRIVESVYWVFFASTGLISFWIPAIVIARGGLTDFLRAIAFARGQTAFGEKTMMKSVWGRRLTGSRGSRAAYGIVKCAAFFALGARLALEGAPALVASQFVKGLYIGAIVLTITTVAFCLLRGAPVIVEGARFFYENEMKRR
ncbi:MAG: CDP-alcohol phosphatidyltransferase family protein [Acidobacteria bacterium]|nr:CDP-alcohol phosphatidyltransferase family protein [Acidobacteriota bacterium]